MQPQQEVGWRRMRGAVAYPDDGAKCRQWRIRMAGALVGGRGRARGGRGKAGECLSEASYAGSLPSRISPRPSPPTAPLAFWSFSACVIALWALRTAKKRTAQKKIVTIRAGRARARPYRLTITTLGRKQTNCRQNLRVGRGKKREAPLLRVNGARALRVYKGRLPTLPLSQYHRRGGV